MQIRPSGHVHGPDEGVRVRGGAHGNDRGCVRRRTDGIIGRVVVAVRAFVSSRDHDHHSGLHRIFERLRGKVAGRARIEAAGRARIECAGERRTPARKRYDVHAVLHRIFQRLNDHVVGGEVVDFRRPVNFVTPQVSLGSDARKCNQSRVGVAGRRGCHCRAVTHAIARRIVVGPRIGSRVKGTTSRRQLLHITPRHDHFIVREGAIATVTEWITRRHRQ